MLCTVFYYTDVETNIHCLCVNNGFVDVTVCDMECILLTLSRLWQLYYIYKLCTVVLCVYKSHLYVCMSIFEEIYISMYVCPYSKTCIEGLLNINVTTESRLFPFVIHMD